VIAKIIRRLAVPILLAWMALAALTNTSVPPLEKVAEAHNVAQLWDGLGLSALPSRATPPPLDLARLSAAALIDMNSAITRGTGALFGLRARPVTIGHQRVLLPMPEEVPFLVNEFLAWLAAELRAAAGPPAAASEGAALPQLRQLQRALSRACI
jgi:hypothetical protein